MEHVLALMALGAAGTLARVGVSSWVQRRAPAGVPLGTAAVNLLGCFAFGLVVALTAQHPASTTLRLIVLGGFMGAFTTFSSYVYDSYQLLVAGRTGLAFANLLLQNGLGLLALFAGLWLGRTS